MPLISLVLAQPALASFPAVPVDVAASSSLAPSLTGPQRLVDHSGRAGDRHDAHSLGHTMWLSGPGAQAPGPAGLPDAQWVWFDLGAPRDLLELTIWNYNQPQLIDRGLRDVRIHASLDGTSWTEVTALTLTQASGATDLAPTDRVDLSVRARHVLITADPDTGTYGDPLGGLSEVAFTQATPDPRCRLPDDGPLELIHASVAAEADRLHTLEPDGWLGGDIAHSVPLSETRSVWLFGDTLVGSSTEGARDLGGSLFYNGSVGIQDRSRPADEQLTYAWGPDPTGLFAYEGPPDVARFYWTSNGIAIDGVLYVFAMNVLDLSEQRGVTVIRVPNPEDPPLQWEQEHTYVDVGGTQRMFHSGLHRQGDWLYLLGFDDSTGIRRTVLARVPVEALEAGLTPADYQYWTEGPGGPGWSSDDADLVTLIDQGATESHVVYEPDLGLYLYTLTTLGGKILLSSAPELTGPWSEPACVYQVPEASWVPISLIMYAARLHPELSTAPGHLVLSYMTNSIEGLGGMFGLDAAQVYRPRLIELQLGVPGATQPTGESPPPTEPPPTDSSAPPTDATPPASDHTGCGCAALAPGGPGPWGLGLLGLLGLRRRRIGSLCQSGTPGCSTIPPT